MRKYLIAGNWKMNMNPTESATLAQSVVDRIGAETEVSATMCPPFTSLEAVSKICDGSNVFLGAQNMHFEASGAFTGEVSADMLRSLYCTHVILGHSERRELFGEVDALVNKKVVAALANNLKPILCVGETLEQREANKTLDVVAAQVKGGLAGVTPQQGESVIIAYEPVWAIGTGKTATPEMAQEVHAAIRNLLGEVFEPTVAAKIRILYGGSMKPANASELLDQPDIDGGLIGGASLKADSFVELVEIAKTKAG